MFDDEAVEAAAKAMFANGEQSWRWQSTSSLVRDRYIEQGRAALTAALASLEQRGRVRRGICMPRLFSGIWDASEKLEQSLIQPDQNFPVTIIKDTTP